MSIDEGKIKDKIIERLMEEARKLVGLEVDHLRRLGYVFVADALEEWVPVIEDWDVEMVSESHPLDLSGLPSMEEIHLAAIAKNAIPPHLLGIERNEPTRLELQARGELEDIQVGDWVHDTIYDEFGVGVDRLYVCWDGRTDAHEKNSSLRLATPAELLEAGIIDEIPGEPLTPLSKEAAADRKPLPPHVLANARSEKIHEDKGNLRASKPLKRAQDQPRDANGELLEVGDVVEYAGEGEQSTLIITEIWRGGRVSVYGHLGYSIPPKSYRKLTSLTEEQYLPLARRTLSESMTKSERISEHGLGLIEEVLEFRENPCIKEAGDVLWYATMLIDVIGERKELALIPKNDSIRWFGIIKKAAHQQRAECLDALHEAATRSVKDISSWAFSKNLSLGEIRLANIKKLIARYPEGFVNGGGER